MKNLENYSVKQLGTETIKFISGGNDGGGIAARAGVSAGSLSSTINNGEYKKGGEIWQREREPISGYSTWLFDLIWG